MTKKEPTEKVKREVPIKDQAWNLLQLLTIASIAFMSYVVITGLDDPVSKALCGPAMVWAALVLVHRFMK